MPTTDPMTPWYKTYFQGLPQLAWKLHQDEDYTQFEAEFLADVLEIGRGSKVLDVMAGYGRHALPLSESGCSLTCLDISEEYCQELSKVVAEKGLDVEVVCGDILEADLGSGRFEAAYCFGNSFSFFARKEMQQFIAKVAAALTSGGFFAIHTENLAESILPNFQMRNWMPVKEEITYLAENEYRAEEGCIVAEQTFISDTEKVTHTVRQYIYTLSEIMFMFENAGFEVTATFADLEANSFSLGDEHLYLIARKL